MIGGLLSLQRTGVEKIEAYKDVYKNLNESGAPFGKTGAPGEQTCSQCHTGSVMGGQTMNSFAVLQGTNPVSSYAPGGTYTATLTLTGTSSKQGFQATALDASGNMAGSFTASSIGGTQVVQGNSRDYATHTSTSNAGGSVWAWTWNAPATDVGSVTFYVATNVANGDGTTGGDEIYLSQHVINGTTTGIEEQNFDNEFMAGYRPAVNEISISFNSLTAERMSINITSLDGKKVVSKLLDNSIIGENKLSISLPHDIKEGIYIVNFFVGNQPMTSKILVKK